MGGKEQQPAHSVSDHNGRAAIGDKKSTATTNDHWHNCFYVKVSRVRKSTRSEARRKQNPWQCELVGDSLCSGHWFRGGTLRVRLANAPKPCPHLLCCPPSASTILAGRAVSSPAVPPILSRQIPSILLSSSALGFDFGMEFLTELRSLAMVELCSDFSTDFYESSFFFCKYKF